jgi:thiol:disulfide interchange protein DsbC
MIAVARRLAWLTLLGVAVSACHQEPAPQSPAKAPQPQAHAATATSASVSPPKAPTKGTYAATSADPAQTARESAVADLLHQKYPRLTLQRLDEVATGGEPVYYVLASNQTLVTNAKVDFLIQGGTLIVGTGDQVRDVSKEMAQRMEEAVYLRLPLDQAMKKVYGKGERQLVMFSDPDCPVCQAFEKVIDQEGANLDATIYTFPMPLAPIHPDAIRKTSYLLCTADPANNWHDWMLHADAGWDTWAAAHKSTPNCPRLELAALGSVMGDRLGLTRTPSLMFPNGQIVQGALTVPQLNTIWAIPALPPLQLPTAPPAAPASTSTAPAAMAPPMAPVPQQ